MNAERCRLLAEKCEGKKKRGLTLETAGVSKICLCMRKLGKQELEW